ncbi:DUF2550 domain-containing protein [Georgenia sp. MJ206]|uniref:DUF2550 domain-containing protein n=1 Tax=Georgenia wangjunii TaxID=3117730 RepID=UPI002F266A48
MGWAWVGVGAAALVLLAALAVALLLWRARTLGRRVGSFECAWRSAGGGEWTSGIAGYGVNRLDWHRLVSLAPQPTARWDRRRLVVLSSGRRAIPGADSDVVEVTCRYGTDEFHLAMRAEAAAGLTSWLEAAPPGDPALTY